MLYLYITPRYPTRRSIPYTKALGKGLKKLTNVSLGAYVYAKNGEMLGFLLGFVIYRIFYKGSKLTVVSLFNLSLTAPRRYFRLRRHYFWNIYLATVSRYLTPVNLIKPSNYFSCRLRGTQLSLQDVLCWLRVINTTAIKPERGSDCALIEHTWEQEDNNMMHLPPNTCFISFASYFTCSVLHWMYSHKWL